MQNLIDSFSHIEKQLVEKRRMKYQRYSNSINLQAKLFLKEII